MIEEPFATLAAGPYRREQLQVDYERGSYQALDGEAEAIVARAWRARRRQTKRDGVPLYSGRLFRVLGYGPIDGGGLRLRLGDTTYRAYVGTRAPAFAVGRQRDELANPLAVCAAIVTADGGIVVGRRQSVDVGAGKLGVPGGFVERGKDADPFAAVAREIREETALELTADDFVCLGLIYDLIHPHYELCFTVRTALSFGEVAQLCPIEVEAACFERLDASPPVIRDFLHRHCLDVSPACAATLALYVGLSKARRAGIPVPPPQKGEAGEQTRENAERDLAQGQEK